MPSIGSTPTAMNFYTSIFKNCMAGVDTSETASHLVKRWTNIGGTIAGDSYFSAHKDIRLMLDVFTQVPLPPGVREHEATYIAE